MLTSCGSFLHEKTCNFQNCEIFQSTYLEEHLQTAASENVFIKIIHKENKLYIKKPRFFQHQYQKQVKMFAFIS